MAKKDKKKEKTPYFIDMNLDLEGLMVPPGSTPVSLFKESCIMAFHLFAVQKWSHLSIPETQQNPFKGLPMDVHRRLWSLRDAFDSAVVTHETNKAKIEYDDFRTLWDVWNKHEPDPSANELTRRVEQRLKDAMSRHDRKENGDN